jgi:hypothetical protein
MHGRKEFTVACHEVTSRRIPRNRSGRLNISKRDMKSAVSLERRLSDVPGRRSTRHPAAGNSVDRAVANRIARHRRGAEVTVGEQLWPHAHQKSDLLRPEKQPKPVNAMKPSARPKRTSATPKGPPITADGPFFVFPETEGLSGMIAHHPWWCSGEHPARYSEPHARHKRHLLRPDQHPLQPPMSLMLTSMCSVRGAHPWSSVVVTPPTETSGESIPPRRAHR